MQPVTLHVYDLGTSEFVQNVNDLLSELNTGAFHVGVEVYGEEYSFACNGNFFGPPGVSPTGVTRCRPRCAGGHSYRESVPMGFTRFPRAQVLRIADRMSRQWLGDSYDILALNCGHFAEAFCRELGVAALPSDLTSLADVGLAAEPLVRLALPEDDMAEEYLEYQLQPRGPPRGGPNGLPLPNVTHGPLGLGLPTGGLGNRPRSGPAATFGRGSPFPPCFSPGAGTRSQPLGMQGPGGFGPVLASGLGRPGGSPLPSQQRPLLSSPPYLGPQPQRPMGPGFGMAGPTMMGPGPMLPPSPMGFGPMSLGGIAPWRSGSFVAPGFHSPLAAVQAAS